MDDWRAALEDWRLLKAEMTEGLSGKKERNIIDARWVWMELTLPEYKIQEHKYMTCGLYSFLSNMKYVHLRQTSTNLTNPAASTPFKHTPDKKIFKIVAAFQGFLPADLYL